MRLPPLLALAASAFTLSALPAVAADAQAGATSIAVEGDVPAFAVPGAGSEVLLYLPGRCGDPFAGVRSFPRAAAAHGTLLVVQGDQPCPDRKGRRRWTIDARRIQARIDAAVEAASTQLGRPLAGKQLTLIGYSEGALRAELLARSFPHRYPRVVLGGEPRTPAAQSLAGAKAVVTLAGEHDVQGPMREGAERLAKAGLTSRFFLLPRARHGQYGPESERVMGEALDWLFEHGR